MPPLRTTIYLPADLLEEAKQYGVNISKAAREGIDDAIWREKRVRELGL